MFFKVNAFVKTNKNFVETLVNVNLIVVVYSATELTKSDKDYFSEDESFFEGKTVISHGDNFILINSSFETISKQLSELGLA